MAEQIKTRMTAAEFLELPDERHPIQLLEGELVEVPPPGLLHQRLVGRLYKLIDNVMPDGEVFVAPVAVSLDEDNVPEPDVVWVAAESRCATEEARLVGPPDLVVEVLSPSTAYYDKTTKFDLYERHGVREYWIVDPLHELLEVWVEAGGVFRRQGVYGPENEAFPSAALRGPVDLKAIFEA